MSAWGISCEIEGEQATVVVVEANGPRTSLGGGQVLLHITDPNADWAQKLNLLVADLDTRLRHSAPAAVVVRSLDWAPRRRATPTMRRYQVEGAALAIARQHVAIVECHSGREIGQICSSTKQAIEDEASAVFGRPNREAGAAAIAGLVILSEA